MRRSKNECELQLHCILHSSISTAILTMKCFEDTYTMNSINMYKRKINYLTIVFRIFVKVGDVKHMLQIPFSAEYAVRHFVKLYP